MRKSCIRFNSFILPFCTIFMALMLVIAAFGAEDKDPIESKLDEMTVSSVQLGDESLRITGHLDSTGGIVIDITVDDDYIRDCSDFSFTVSPMGTIKAKEAVTYSLSSDNTSMSLENIEVDKKYFLYADVMRDGRYEALHGYFSVSIKNQEPSVEYAISCEVGVPMDDIKGTIDMLRSATETVNRFSGTSNKSSELDNAQKAVAKASLRGNYFETEENDTMAEANVVNDDDTMYAAIGCLGDIDFYKVQFDSNGNANFWMGDIPSGNDYDMELYSSSGVLLQTSNSVSNQEQIYGYPVFANTWYYIKIFASDGSYDYSNYYRLRVKNYPSPAADSYEPNDMFTTATNISLGTTITDANINISIDEDYYAFTISNASYLTITLSNIPTNCDYDLALFNSSHAYESGSTNNGNTTEVINYSASAGTYYIRVNSYSGSSSAFYTLSLSGTNNSNSPDSHEVNNTLATATPVSAPTLFTGSIHSSSDIDYYSFTLSSAEEVVINMQLIPVGCNYDIELLNSSGSYIASSTNTGNTNEHIDEMLSPGTYYICVYSTSGCSSSLYRVTIAVIANNNVYTLAVYNYLDTGFRTRFSNASNAVSGYVAVVNDIFVDLFHLSLTSTNQNYTSYADSCKILSYGSVTSSNLAASCNHQIAHLKTSALRTKLISDKGSGTSTLTRILWTGHILENNARSSSSSSSHTVVITPACVVDSSYNNLSANTIAIEQKFSLLHELSHQLGAHDHYCYEDGGENSPCSNPYCTKCTEDEDPPSCVMTNRCNIETTDEEDLYCSECSYTITNHVLDHH